MKTTRKSITINGEFDNVNDLKESLMMVLEQIELGNRSASFTKNGMDFKVMAHEKEITVTNETNDQELMDKIVESMKWQEIDGKLNLVIQSRINYEK